MKIKGITVTLWDKVKTGVDELRQPIYEEVAEEVENVLVAPVTDEEIVDTLNLTGKLSAQEARASRQIFQENGI